MASSVWKGTILFGLVSIPIRLYTAPQNHRDESEGEKDYGHKYHASPQEKFGGAACITAKNGPRSCTTAETQGKLMKIFFGDNCQPST
jgi:hypothetical protein